jgi:TPR repeat protein
MQSAMIKLIFPVTMLLLSSCLTQAGDASVTGELNPEEGGIAHLAQTLAAHPDRAGFACWVVYEAQKGGLHEDAMEALQTCAQSGNEPSMILMSHAYENGLGVVKSDVLATYWVRQAALRFYPTGQYHYGIALLEGRGTNQDEAQGRFWLERAALGGDRDAAARLRDLQPLS